MDTSGEIPGWECKGCTFVNNPMDGCCKLCNTWKKTNKTPKTSSSSSSSSSLPSSSSIDPFKKFTSASSSSSSSTSKSHSSTGTTGTKPGKRKYRQAAETEQGEVEILCYTCRRNPNGKIQKSITSMFTKTSKIASNLPSCSRCRQPLKRPKKTSSATSSLSKCPYIKRIDGYKKIASDHDLPFDITDSAAVTIMRKDCLFCGKKAGIDGNGLTRIRTPWPERHEKARKTFKVRAGRQYMGPFCIENLASACSICNLMKSARRPRSYVELCRHIATFRTSESFGLYPHRFRNNISKRNRSSYIHQSSTHTKTHSLTNELFNLITSKPCHYCGKVSQPDAEPPHHNGLDRLDSDERVYSEDTVVSCCGDCNMAKYTHLEDFFINHVVKVSRFHVETVFEEDNEQMPRKDNNDAVLNDTKVEEGLNSEKNQKQ